MSRLEPEYNSLTPEVFAAEIEEAARVFDVVRSTPTTLLLDLDTLASREQFTRVLPKVRDYFGIVRAETWESKSGNMHVKLTLASPHEISTRLLLQAALGSDGVREVLGWVRVVQGCVEPSVLFKPKEAVVV